MTSRRRALLIVNCNARRGSGPLKTALDVLSGGLELVEQAVSGRDGIPLAIKAQAGNVECVILGGGDGTLNAAAPALIETGLPLGILPLGTANDLARTLEIGPDPVQAAHVIVAGKVRRIDLGLVNDVPFFNVASIGLSAKLARTLTGELKRRWGVLGYPVASARLLARMRPIRIELDHDGTTEIIRTFQLSVGNGRYYGGGMAVESTARPDDGRLDVYSLEMRHWWQMLSALPALRRGTQGARADVRAFPTTELKLRTRRWRWINTDGELTTRTPAHFRILPGAIQVYAPENERAEREDGAAGQD